jgi:hypothetical protein
MSKVLWPDGTLPVFVTLYANLGVLNGALTVGAGTDLAPTDNPVQGRLFWKRPVSTKVGDRLYAAGFETDVDVSGGAYVAPAAGYRVLDLGNGTTHALCRLELDDGGLGSKLTTALTISTANKVTAFTPNDHTYVLSFVPATGAFSGSFTVPSPTRKVSIQGLVVPDFTAGKSGGYGYFLLPGATASSPILSGNAWTGKP